MGQAHLLARRKIPRELRLPCRDPRPRPAPKKTIFSLEFSLGRLSLTERASTRGDFLQLAVDNRRGSQWREGRENNAAREAVSALEPANMGLVSPLEPWQDAEPFHVRLRGVYASVASEVSQGSEVCIPISNIASSNLSEDTESESTALSRPSPAPTAIQETERPTYMWLVLINSLQMRLFGLSFHLPPFALFSHSLRTRMPERNSVAGEQRVPSVVGIVTSFGTREEPSSEEGDKLGLATKMPLVKNQLVEKP